MATSQWGKVYFQNDFAGLLREEPGGRFVFEYDKSYLEQKLPRIAHTLPLREAAYNSEGRLHPFFDNLVAEGWLLNAQARAVGVSPAERFRILLAFGRDCIGAVSIVDPAPPGELKTAGLEEGDISFLSSRASLSGIQRKLPVVFRAGEYWPAKKDETGTHIAKLVSGDLTDLMELEYLSTLAVKKLLPKDKIVEPEIAMVKTVRETAFIVRRFDRTEDGKKIHFEEFSQLLGIPAGDAKYNAAYDDIAKFIQTTPGCIPAETEILFRRILGCFLIGNTDAHLKNFAMFSEPNSLRLTPSYDMVGSALYPQFGQIALAIGTAANLSIRSLQAKHIIMLGKNFGLPRETIDLAIQDLKKQLESAKDAIAESAVGSRPLRDKLIDFMEKRWNGTFSSIGKILSKRQ